jgi:hypothetical protein
MTQPPDPIDESSRESFPASDPPSWEPLHSGPPKDDGRGFAGWPTMKKVVFVIAITFIVGGPLAWVLVGRKHREPAVASTVPCNPQPDSAGTWALCAVDSLPVFRGNALLPRYPVILENAHVAGSATLLLRFDTLGHPDMLSLRAAGAANSNELFFQEARRVVPYWKFTPAWRGGRRAAVWIPVRFDFLAPPGGDPLMLDADGTASFARDTFVVTRGWIRRTRDTTLAKPRGAQ